MFDFNVKLHCQVYCQGFFKIILFIKTIHGNAFFTVILIFFNFLTISTKAWTFC